METIQAVQPVRRVVYRVDDIVRVVNPEIVVRVGYPLTKQDALNNDYIHTIMRAVGAEQDESITGGLDYEPSLYHDLLNALSSWWLKQRNYGGKERRIYTERDERLLQTKWRVLSRRRVKTGTYHPGGYSCGYDFAPDYDPPHLRNEQTHVLLALEPLTFPLYEEIPSRIEIEAANVELENDDARR